MSMHYSRNLQTCRVCQKCEMNTDGVYVCTLNGRPIEDNALAHDCPRSRYPSRGAGDTVKKVLDTSGIGPITERIIWTLTRRPCNCEKRRAWLNRKRPYKTPV